MRATVASALESHVGATLLAMLAVLIPIGIPFFAIYVRTRWTIAGFYPYLGCYLVALSVLLALYPGRRDASLASVGKLVVWGIVSGYVASVVGYVGLVFLPDELERLARTFTRWPAHTLLAFLIAPLPLLLWLYGGLIGLVIGLVKSLRA